MNTPNPAAPSPSDSSIAQAFRDYQAKWPSDADTGMAGWIERRAREIDASAPAAAVGGGWMMRLAKEIKANAEDHPGDYIAKFALAWADELAARAVSTPAAPVGGFVVVPREPTEAIIYAIRWAISPEDVWEKALNAASPAAQPSCQTCNGTGWLGGPTFAQPDEGGEQCPDCDTLEKRVALPSAKGGVRGEFLSLPDEGAYLIRYDDHDEEDELFSSAGAKESALRRYRERSLSWNAHLFVKIASNSRDCGVPNATTAAGLVDGNRVFDGAQTLGSIVTDETGMTTGLVLYIDEPQDGGPVTRQGAYDHCRRCFIDSTTAMPIEPNRWQFRPEAAIGREVGE